MARGVDPNAMAKERARRAVLEVRAHRALRLPVWLLPIAIALVALVEAAVLVRQTPPAAKPVDAPDSEFSAHRARALLERILGDGAPRPTGSAANARARERILAELSALGHRASVETGMVCGQWGVCAQVNNVVSRIAGRESGPAVLLSAHYDSVPAAPGAADDGSGVAAILEVARVLKHAPPRRPVVLLLGDGEELGLLGAELFVRESRYFAEVDAVVNLEARGSSGPSLMFETSPGNAAVIGAFARAVSRPLTSSAFYEVYRRLPNDSDFSVFKAHGLVGYNFAFIGGMGRYHTPRDELSALDLRSLQHNGDNALSSVRALTELSQNHTNHDAVFFDVLGWRVIWWKDALSPWLAGGAAFLLLLALAVGVLRGAFRGDAFLLSLLLVPAVLAAAAVVGLVLEVGLRAFGALPSAWVAHPEPALAACVVIAAGAVTALAAAAGPERAAALWGAIWAWFCVGAGAAVAKLPGASFLLLVPVLAAALFGLLWFAFPRNSALWSSLAALAPILATAVLWLPKVSLLYTAVGFVSLPALCLTFALPALSLAPLLATPTGSLRRSLLVTAVILVPAGAVTALFVPRTSRDNPARLSLAFHQDTDTGTARYLADVSWAPLPEAFAAAGVQFAAADPRPWTGVGRAVAAPAPKLELPAPEFDVTERETGARGERRLRGRLRSPRGAPMIRLVLSSKVELKVGGVKASQRFESPSYASTFIVSDPGGVELELRVQTAEKVSALIVDHSYGLPAAAQKLGLLRNDTAVPFHFGDATVVSRGTIF
jgi:hypothetical protein